jgi:cell division protein FtsB
MKFYPRHSPQKNTRQAEGGGNRGLDRLISYFNFSRRNLLWVFPVLLGIGFLALLVKGQGEIRKMRDLAQKREVLIVSNQELNRKNEEMYREISRLKQDPIYLEEIARKEFGLVKPDEIIFFFDEAKTKEAPRNVTAGQFTHR